MTRASPAMQSDLIGYMKRLAFFSSPWLMYATFRHQMLAPASHELQLMAIAFSPYPNAAVA